MYRVLIVDDEPMICQGLKKLIEQTADEAVEIWLAENGIHALEQLSRRPADFVFTDIRMPKMDGLALCREISEKYPDAQVVVVSGYGEFEYARKCMSYGVVDYLLKPINKRGVQQVLHRLADNFRRKGENAVYFSPTVAEYWTEQIFGAIWALDDGKLDELLAAWKREYEKYHFSGEHQAALLEEFFSMLIKQMTARGMHADSFASSGKEQPGQPGGFEDFRARVLRLQGELKDIRKGKFKDPVEEAKLYIENNLSREVSLDEIAHMLGLNPSYFSQLFKQRTHETFIHYRIKRKMEKAKRLLEQPHYRITDVSYEIGYADHPHFTKTFKKVTGISPSEYRKMMGIE